MLTRPESTPAQMPQAQTHGSREGWGLGIGDWSWAIWGSCFFFVTPDLHSPAPTIRPEAITTAPIVSRSGPAAT